ncbi:hypothetical protein B0H10DRAFT_2199226 [Mycena sp. CBHHK59/15]|nr:hypothetical protein B0H10DRAFT_2199226 [Mycena sp. CBHHK59/15]
MPFTPVATLDPEMLKLAEQMLCAVFDIPSLHPHQLEVGQNILKGITTILDVPTGGGKTLAFWYALFYRWQPCNTDAHSQKIVLVVGPLVALMEAQAKKLNLKAIPAVAITSRSTNVEGAMSDLGQNKYRVGLVGPEMALSAEFHAKVLNQKKFTKNVSNEKLNVSLEVRIVQHEPDSFADLMYLFSGDGEEFLQTLIYANGRQDTEKIQDFLRDNRPESLDATAFEFYHRHIEEARKIIVQERIESGELRATSATDALGLGMDFQAIMRVILWMCPRTFLSLVQKIGRCVRDQALQGESVLFITKAMYTRCCVELELLRMEEDEANDASASSDDESAGEYLPDRDNAAEAPDTSDEEEDTAHYLLEYITTTKCRRIPWNKYFGNKDKKHLNHPVPDGPCCDNCQPEEFQVETIVLIGGHQLKAGRKEKAHRNWRPRDDVVDTLAQRARLFTSIESIRDQTYWIFAPKYGEQILKAIQEVLLDFPDLVKEARETQAAERAQRYWMQQRSKSFVKSSLSCSTAATTPYIPRWRPLRLKWVLGVNAKGQRSIVGDASYSSVYPGRISSPITTTVPT